MFPKPYPIHWMTALTNAMQQAHGSSLESWMLECALDYFGREMVYELLDDNCRWGNYYDDFLVWQDGGWSYVAWDFDAALSIWCVNHPADLLRWAEHGWFSK